MVSQVETSIDVERDVSRVYNQWTQFEDFPRFMEGVERVQQLDDTHLRWEADFGLAAREWNAEITEQVPDQVIAWRATGDVTQAGRVVFEPLAEGRTRVQLRIVYNPDDLLEKTADALNVVQRRVEGDLARFKDFIESRHVETGAWRGEVR